jgi:8-oxo-dGTP pyrophosphatase MutT (NUDIX family)
MISFHEQLRQFFRTYRRVELMSSQLTRAGVLVGIFEKRDEAYFLLTKRTDDVEHHKGQISFPGGAVDAGDRDIVATSLRETEEEIGLTAEHIDVVGTFDDIIIPTGFMVTPVVGYIDELPPLKLNRTEVESVLEVPLSFFQESKNKKVVKMMRGGVLHDVYFFTYGEFQIWGATAAVINSFLSKLALPA